MPPCAEPLPVLVWFHGGAFVLGASSQASHAGDRLAAEQDVIVVSANYRLGALGFLDTRAIGGDVANLGLHDAIAALEWVRDNIAAFGGDPTRVTMFGLSAGGGVGLHLLASPAAAGLFGGVIVQSGITDRTLDAPRAALVATTLCEAAGVADLEGLRRLDVDELLAAQGAALVALMKPVGVLPFHPCVDGELVLGPPAAMLGDGAAAGIRLLAGSAAQELNSNFGMRMALEPDRLLAQVGRYLQVSSENAASVIAR